MAHARPWVPFLTPKEKHVKRKSYYDVICTDPSGPGLARIQNGYKASLGYALMSSLKIKVLKTVGMHAFEKACISP